MQARPSLQALSQKPQLNGSVETSLQFRLLQSFWPLGQSGIVAQLGKRYEQPEVPRAARNAAKKGATVRCTRGIQHDGGREVKRWSCGASRANGCRASRTQTRSSARRPNPPGVTGSEPTGGGGSEGASPA